MDADHGVQVRRSPMPYAETVERLKGDITARGLNIFDVVDHRAAAVGVGLDLRPTVVIVFGSPAAGTPLMERCPELALELPLRIAVWDGGDGHARVAYLPASSLVAQFDLDPAHVAPLAAPAAIVGQLTGT